VNPCCRLCSRPQNGPVGPNNNPQLRVDTRGRPVSRILFRGLLPFDDHSSERGVATRALAAYPDLLGLKRPRLPYGDHAVPIRHCSRWGLPCQSCCQSRGELLPHRFTLAPRAGRSILCGAFRRVSPPGHYPAPSLHGVRTFLPGDPGITEGGHPAFRAIST